jgi:hypothetical protein
LEFGLYRHTNGGTIGKLRNRITKKRKKVTKRKVSQLTIPANFYPTLSLSPMKSLVK